MTIDPTATIAEMEDFVAGLLPGIRTECYRMDKVRGTRRFEHPVDCGTCHNRGYLPRRGDLAALLNAANAQGWVIMLKCFTELKSCHVWARDAVDDAHFLGWQADAPTPYEAVLRAMMKATATTKED